MLHRWDGIGLVMSGTWFPTHVTLRIGGEQFNLGFSRQQRMLFLSLSVLKVFFCKIEAGSLVSFTEERLLSGCCAIKPRSV